MSKSKKRVLHRNKDCTFLSCSRAEAVKLVASSVRMCKFDKLAQDMISLFGISGEELAEAGLTWEELKIVSAYL